MVKKKQETGLRVNVLSLYEHMEKLQNFNSINQTYRTDEFKGNFTGYDEFSGRFGTTGRYMFQTENEETWSLLSSSKILAKIILEIPIGTDCEVYKNDNGHWMIVPV